MQINVHLSFFKNGPSPDSFSYFNYTILGAVVVAQLVERPLTIPEVRGSNPVFDILL